MQIKTVVNWEAVREDLVLSISILAYWAFGLCVLFTGGVLVYKYCRWVWEALL
jgi:hypothetical protein